MHERSFHGDLARIKRYAGVSLLFDCLIDWFGLSFFDCALYFILLIYPIVDGNSTLGILLYFIRQLQAWHLPLPEDIMQCRGANAKFFGYASLLFVVALHPFCEFIHLIPLFYIFFWTEIRNSDTIVIIPREKVNDNVFLRWYKKMC